MLTIKDLRVNYGGIEAVKGISFEVPEKSIVTLIGANGAQAWGKTKNAAISPQKQILSLLTNCGSRKFYGCRFSVIVNQKTDYFEYFFLGT